MAFIDTDEFLVIDQADIKELLSGYESEGGLAVNMRFFGDSGFTTRPQALQIASFVRCARVGHPRNRLIKSIAMTSRVLAPSPNPHWFKYIDGWRCVNSSGVAVPGPEGDVVFDQVQLNHYWSRSRGEFQGKVLRGGGNGLRRQMQMYDEFQAFANEDVDLRIVSKVGLVQEMLRYSSDDSPR